MTTRGFTLIELLVVVAIVATVAAMILAVPATDRREADVRASADELAAVLRSCRAMAMERRGVYGVSFQIENQPDSSGRQLNNRSGGHWYRVIGPRDETTGNLSLPGTGYPPMYSRTASSLNGASCKTSEGSPVPYFLEAVDRAWIGDRRLLPAGKVRFVALADQDNGDFRASSSDAYPPSTSKGDTYPATYPRPWFGWWDQASGRLHAWGGYDPDLPMTAQTSSASAVHPPRSLDGRVISHSGFFYEGYDGRITGCRNPSDRSIYHDSDNNGTITGSESALYRLWRQGDPRPLINARWLDCMLYFLPDGTAAASWMSMRHACATEFDKTGNLFYDPSLSGNTVLLPSALPAGKHHMMELGPGDMCNRMSSGTGGAAEASWSAGRSGYYFVTLGPDLANDTDTFASANAALQAIMPMYRVGVSPFGDVVVRRVRRDDKDGVFHDTTLTGTDWNDRTKTDAAMRDHQRVIKSWPAWEKAYYTATSYPFTDVVTERMLTQRIWWSTKP